MLLKMYNVKCDHKCDLGYDCLIGDGRGIPIVINCKNNKGFLCVPTNHNYSINGKKLNKMYNISLKEALSCTSAYLGVLADREMCVFLKTQLNIFLRQYIFYTHKLNQNHYDFAPCLKLHHNISARFADGCFWDDHAIITSLIGLQTEKKLNNSTIIVICTNKLMIAEFWSSTSKKSKLYPNPTIFDGDMIDNVAYFAEDRHKFVYVFKNCKLNINFSLKGIISNKATINMVVIGIHAKNFNSFPFNKSKQWQMYDESLNKNLTKAISDIKINNIIRDRSYAISISGGGVKAALLGKKAIKILTHVISVPPAVVSGNSGGAWGIFLYYIYPNKNSLEFILENLQRFDYTRKNYSWYSFFNIFDFETIDYLLPILKEVNDDWTSFIEHMLIDKNVKEKTVSWKIFPPNLRVMMPTTLLSNSWMCQC